MTRMKRKNTFRFVLFLLATMLIFVIVSCDDGSIDASQNQPSIGDTTNKTDITDEYDEPNNSDKKDNATTTQQPDHDHIYEIIVLVEPSCGVEGKQVYECVICGKQQHELSISPLAPAHNYRYSSELSIAPTCTGVGKKVEHCYTCGQTKEDIWAATGHKWYITIDCDSVTNELVITPYCTKCPLVSQHEYRYKVNDVSKLTPGTLNVFGDLGVTIIGGMGNATSLKAPYYAVYCNAEYLLIVRSSNSIAGYVPDGAVIGGNPLDYYKKRGCTILFETNMIITEDGRIQFVN